MLNVSRRIPKLPILALASLNGASFCYGTVIYLGQPSMALSTQPPRKKSKRNIKLPLDHQEEITADAIRLNVRYQIRSITIRVSTFTKLNCKMLIPCVRVTVRPLESITKNTDRRNMSSMRKIRTGTIEQSAATMSSTGWRLQRRSGTITNQK